MKAFITPHTLANTVRMGTNRPVFIATSDEDVRLLAKMAGERSWRIIPAHDKDRAIAAMSILLAANWSGLLTICSGPVACGQRGEDVLPPDARQGYDYIFEGDWKEIESRSSDFAGCKVRLTVMRPANEIGSVPHRSNQAEARRELIYSLPGMYHLVSTDEYMEEKRREAELEDR